MKLLTLGTCVLIVCPAFFVKCSINFNVFDRFTTCKYQLGNLVLELSNQQVIVSKFGVQIKLSPCAPTNPTANCDPKALVCGVDNSKKQIINAGKQFTLTEHTDSDNPGEVQIMLMSMYGDSCKADPSKNYTTYVSFGKKTQPRLLDATDCEFYVEMFDPNIELPCTKKLNGYLLDFRSLAGEVKIQSKNETFFVNFCGPAKSCGDRTAAACQVSNDSVKIIGSLTTQKIVVSQSVHMTYQFGIGRKRLKTDVHLKCNWNVFKGNGRYMVPQIQGKNYRFIIESSLGCVKFPMRCQIHDLHTNYQYNLNDLYKPNSFWSVSGIRSGRMNINVCGPLKSGASGVCAANYSQVCHTDSNGRNFNYGSILTYSDVFDDAIRLTLSEGSVCTQNKSLTLSSNIVFKCNAQEKGPTLLAFKNCSVELLWETPKACPYFDISGHDCAVMDILGKRDVSAISTNIDRKHKLNANSYIRYNLCGNLIKKCGNSNNVSVCLHLQKKQFVLGFTSTNLISSDGLLSLVMHGERCRNKEFQRKVNVKFVCSFAASSTEVEVTVVHDQCIYNMTVTTLLACVSKNEFFIDDCSIINESSIYNLTLLSQTDRNYAIKVPGRNVVYSINVCRPTLTTADALCIMNTGVCLQNISEPNFKNRYYSVGAQQTLIVENNELQLRYTYGKLCGESVDSSTIIHFKCSLNEEKLSFLRETNCIHEFTWNTAHACPKRLQIPRSLVQECVLKDEHGYSLNLTNMNNRKMQLIIDRNFVYLFNICNGQYTRVISGNRNETGRARRRFFRNENNTYIEFKLNGTCTEVGEVNTVLIHLTCSSKLERDNIVLKSFKNCTAVLVETCKEEYPLMNNLNNASVYSTDTYSEQSKQEYVATSNPMKNNCTVFYNNLSINVNAIKPVSIFSQKKLKYTIGFGEKFLNCSGFVCKEDSTIATLEECPSVQVTDVDLLLNFSSRQGYSVNIWFKCNITQNVPTVFEDGKHIVLTYPLWKMCTLHKSGSGFNFTKILWILVALLILLIAFLAVAILNKFGFCNGYRKISSDKSSVQIYCKNLRE